MTVGFVPFAYGQRFRRVAITREPQSKKADSRTCLDCGSSLNKTLQKAHKYIGLQRHKLSTWHYYP